MRRSLSSSRFFFSSMKKFTNEICQWEYWRGVKYSFHAVLKDSLNHVKLLECGWKTSSFISSSVAEIFDEFWAKICRMNLDSIWVPLRTVGDRLMNLSYWFHQNFDHCLLYFQLDKRRCDSWMKIWCCCFSELILYMMKNFSEEKNCLTFFHSFVESLRWKNPFSRLLSSYLFMIRSSV